MKNLPLFILLSSLCGLALFLSRRQSLDTSKQADLETHARTSGAGKSLNNWFFERAYPSGTIQVEKLEQAFEYKKQFLSGRSPAQGEWESLGPQNVGGRILGLAMHPEDPQIMFAASASGGLWRTETAGEGIDAWQQVSTGHPALSIGSVAIHPTDPDTMLVGTGEVYGNVVTEPGTINRLTRGIYGIGILRSIDGGKTWDRVLQFETSELHGVQDIEFSISKPGDVYAATTEGLYKSEDAGENWDLVYETANCIDVEVDPSDNQIIYLSAGNFNYSLDPALSGLYKSSDGGKTFTELLHPGLLNAWSGNAKLSIDPNNTSRIFASIQVGWFNRDSITPGGLYLSEDKGSTWNKMNDQNIAMFQGWYSHDIAINPENSNELMYVGIDAWRSSDGGFNFIKKSSWGNWDFGRLNVDVPEGGPLYVHADMHAVYFHPITNHIFIATDGGVFVSKDGGETYTTLNGGLQTTQFYADVSSSTTDPDFFIGGTQDNASYIYDGQPAWIRVIGGDGMTAAVNPINDEMVFGSYQGLNILRSDNGGGGFYDVGPPRVQNDPAPFSGHYVIAPSLPFIMYAGASYLYMTSNNGSDWAATTSSPVDPGNVIVKIAVSPFDHEKILLATSPDPLSPQNLPGMFRSHDGGRTFSELSGLPNRICKDIEFDPLDDNRAYAVFSGFGTDHVFVSEDFGDNWKSIQNGLPDIPTNAIFVDPQKPETLYVGNDLGVYYSENSGDDWQPWMEGLPEIILAMDLNYSPANRKLRVATHGHGIFQRDLIEDVTSVSDRNLLHLDMVVFPNPAKEYINIELMLRSHQKLEVTLANGKGQIVDEIYNGSFKGEKVLNYRFPGHSPAGTYHVLVKDGNYVVGYHSVVLQ